MSKVTLRARRSGPVQASLFWVNPKHWLSKGCTAAGEGCWSTFAYSDANGPAAHTLPSCSQAESTLGTGSWGLAQMLC